LAKVGGRTEVEPALFRKSSEESFANDKGKRGGGKLGGGGNNHSKGSESKKREGQYFPRAGADLYLGKKGKGPC